MLRFQLTEINANPIGWGPFAVQEELKDLPYAQFSKSDKLGRVADWSVTQGRTKTHERERGFQTSVQNTTFSIQADEETSFHLVDNTKARPTGVKVQQRSVVVRNTRQKDSQYTKIGYKQGKMQGQKGKPRTKTSFKPSESDIKTRESIKPGPEWKIVDEFDFGRLSKLSYEVSAPEDLTTCGKAFYIDKSYDKVTPSKQKSLKVTDKVFYKVTTQDDPIIQKLVEEKTANVYATDSIVAVLMSCPRSVYSWDLIVTKKGDTIFFDKRHKSSIDSMSVNETSNEPPSDESGVNSPDALSREATLTLRHFSQQLLKPESTEFDEPSPFGTECAQVGYRYRKWTLDKGITMVIRTEIDYVDKGPAGDIYGSIKSLNEFDPKISGWKKLESQSGSVLASEIKNNSFKIAKWLCQAHLAGASQMKVGFISRHTPKDSTKHFISLVQTAKPQELSSQMNLSFYQSWGILNAFVQYFIAKEDGTYVIIKDPAKAVLKVYRTTDDLLAAEDDELILSMA